MPQLEQFLITFKKENDCMFNEIQIMNVLIKCSFFNVIQMIINLLLISSKIMRDGFQVAFVLRDKKLNQFLIFIMNLFLEGRYKYHFHVSLGTVVRRSRIDGLQKRNNPILFICSLGKTQNTKHKF